MKDLETELKLIVISAILCVSARHINDIQNKLRGLSPPANIVGKVSANFC
jgi:hypothetical protein